MARTLARIALGTAAAVAVLAWTGHAPAPVGVTGPPAPQPLPAERVFSFFALGDTGEILPWRSLFEGQRSVARALARADRAAPVDRVQSERANGWAGVSARYALGGLGGPNFG